MLQLPQKNMLWSSLIVDMKAYNQQKKLKYTAGVSHGISKSFRTPPKIKENRKKQGRTKIRSVSEFSLFTVQAFIN